MILKSTIHHYSGVLEKIKINQFMMKQLDHANPAGMELTSLSLVTEPLLPEISTISGLHPIRSSGSRLDDTTTDTSFIRFNQETTTLARLGKVDQNVSLGSLDIIPDVQRGGIVWSGNDSTGMNPPGPIGGNGPQVYGQRSFNTFYSIAGISDLFKRILPWHDEM